MINVWNTLKHVITFQKAFKCAMSQTAVLNICLDIHPEIYYLLYIWTVDGSFVVCLPWSCKTADTRNSSDYQLLYLEDYGIMPPGQGAHQGRKAWKLIGVREGTDAMVTRPQHVPWLSYEAHLCHFGCQHCIGYLNGISMPHPSFSARFRGQITIQSKSHVILISWISSGKNATTHFTYHTLQLFLNEPHAYLLQEWSALMPCLYNRSKKLLNKTTCVCTPEPDHL